MLANKTVVNQNMQVQVNGEAAVENAIRSNI